MVLTRIAKQGHSFPMKQMTIADAGYAGRRKRMDACARLWPVSRQSSDVYRQGLASFA
jgi:hypothetical protein